MGRKGWFQNDMAPDALAALSKDELVALVLALMEQNRALQARIAELEARLGLPPKTSDNSSLPPAKGPKQNRPERQRKPRQGHPGVARQPATTPDVVREVLAPHCTGCGQPLGSADQPELAHAYDHIDLPPIRPVITRVHLRRGSCPCCGAHVTAPPPRDMAPGSPFGPGIVALVSYLHVRHMVSYRRLVEMLHGLFGLALSEGAIANMLARAATPFAGDADRIETEGRVSDRYGAQSGHGRAHQLCLAHLLRDAQYAIDAGDRVFAPGFRHLLKRALAIGRRGEALGQSTLVAYRRDLERRLDRLLAGRPRTPTGCKLRAAIAKCRDKLFVFVTRCDVPATNNASERALRPSVIFRKVTNGFRSVWGAGLYAAICSVIATAALRGMSAPEAIRLCLSGPSVLKPA